MTTENISTDKNTVLKTGEYFFYFEANIFPSQIARALSKFREIIEVSADVLENKKIKIIEVNHIEKTNLIKMHLYLLDNPVPVGVVVAVIIGLLGMFGLLLSLSKIEKIVDSPAGIGIGLWLIIGALAFGYTYYTKAKGK